MEGLGEITKGGFQNKNGRNSRFLSKKKILEEEINVNSSIKFRKAEIWI